MGENGYDGLFNTDEVRTIIDLVVDGDQLSFAFDQPGMGRVEITGTVTDGTFEGTAHPEGQNPLPMTATLQTADSE